MAALFHRLGASTVFSGTTMHGCKHYSDMQTNRCKMPLSSRHWSAHSSHNVMKRNTTVFHRSKTNNLCTQEYLAVRNFNLSSLHNRLKRNEKIHQEINNLERNWKKTARTCSFRQQKKAPRILIWTIRWYLSWPYEICIFLSSLF